MLRDKRTIFGVTAVLAVGLVFFVARSQDSLPGTYLPEAVVELREDGFYPGELTVVRGQTVIFKTSRDKPFWPASDLHPTHDIYPEFDPLEPIESDIIWSFRFDKVGEWRYHDHLFPLYRGTIWVIEDTNAETLIIGCDERMGDNAARLKCGEEIIQETLNRQGLEGALSLLSSLYEEDWFRAGNCHEYAHLIGQEAYLKFAKDGKIEASDKTTYCGYGFYHGFMEMLFAGGDNIERARELCGYMDEQMARQTRYAGPACFHGIGHGLVDGSDRRTWGDPHALSEYGLEVCDKVAASNEEYYRCYSGVFNSLSIAYAGNMWGLRLSDDFLGFCSELDPKYQEACYSDMAVAIIKAVDDDFDKAISRVGTIGQDNNALAAMRALAGIVARDRINERDHTTTINSCKRASGKLVNECLAGFASGLIEFGQPGEEYKKPFIFCEADILAEDEKDACFSMALRYLSFVYPAEKMNEICGLVNQKYTQFCTQPSVIR